MSLFEFLSDLFKRNDKKCKKEIEYNQNNSLKFLKMLIDKIPNPIFYKDENGIYRYCNNAFADCLGIEKDSIIGHTVYDISQKDLADIYHKADNELLRTKDTQIYEAKLKSKDGIFYDVIFHKAVIIDEKDTVNGIVGIITDITERKKVEERIHGLLDIKQAMVEVNQSLIGIKDSNELFELILDNTLKSIKKGSVGSILVLDENRNLKIVANKGYLEKDAEKFTIKVEQSFTWSATNGKIDKTVIVNSIDKMEYAKVIDTDEGLKIKSTISSPIFIEEKLYGFVNVDSPYDYAFDEADLEIMEYMRNQIQIAFINHKLYEEIKYLSRFDKLTNVYNRRYFEDLFDKCINRSTTYDEKFLLVVFDLNDLKLINDTYGHLIGDEIIKVFAECISNNIRYSDIFARFGGDEFVGVFLDTDYKSLVDKFEALIEYLRNNPIIVKESNVICSFSYGIAHFPQDGKRYSELIRIADERMYKCKQKMKNKI